jgi:signal peptidase II
MRLIYGVAGAAVIVDQVTKYAVGQWIALGESIPVVANVFHISLVHNSGIAFGLFRGQPVFWLVVITVSLIVLIVLAHYVAHFYVLQRIAFGIILGGAAGNWIDRIRVGYVIDFLDFRVWPVFNVADSCITMGVAMLILIAVSER